MRRTLIMLATVLCVIAFSVGCLQQTSTVRYESPEEAFKNDYTNPQKDILAIFTEGNVAIAFYEIADTKVTYKYIIKDDKGWIPPIGVSQGRAKHNIDLGTYFVKHFEDKYDIIFIDGSFGSKKDAQINDNIGSMFQYGEILQAGGTDTDRIWFTSMEKMPDDYVLTVDGQNITFN
jgi:hypothetical protein